MPCTKKHRGRTTRFQKGYFVSRLRTKCPYLVLFFALAFVALVGGCSQIYETGLATPLPTEYLPTAVALTLEASGVRLNTHPLSSPFTPTLSTVEITSMPSEAPFTTTPALPITDYLTPTAPPTLTPTFVLPGSELTATFTPLPPIPDARVQIYRLGELSLVTSPIQVTARLTSRYGKVVRIELYGEDGRLLSRYVKVFTNVPWTAAMVGTDLEFEISAAAEAGRLVISVEDSYGRLIDVNSVNLILLSTGTTEINPASALYQAIVIQDPIPKTMIQGGKLYTSGLAKPFSLDQPLKVIIIGQDGRVLGQRLAGITYTTPGFHGTFFAEVSYSVSELTHALLVVYEDGGVISEIAHLASVEVVLSP